MKIERVLALTSGTSGITYAERQQLAAGDALPVLESAARKVRRSMVVHALGGSTFLAMATLHVLRATVLAEHASTRPLDLPWLNASVQLFLAVSFGVTIRGSVRNLRALRALIDEEERPA